MLRRLLPRTIRASTQSRTFSRISFQIYGGATSAPGTTIHENHLLECSWTIRSDRDVYPHHRNEWQMHLSSTPRVEDELKILSFLNPGVTPIHMRPDSLRVVENDVIAPVKVSDSTAETSRQFSTWERERVQSIRKEL